MFLTPEFCRPAVQAALKIAAFALMAGVASGAAAVAPANDLCDDAAMIGVPSSTAGSTTDSTFDGVPFCGTVNTTGGVWYKFTAPASGTVRTSTCNMANYDTKISVFKGTCGAPVCVAGQDDNFGAGCTGFTTQLDFPVTGGTEYRVLVHGFSSQTGDFTLDTSQISVNTFEENIAGARDGINALMQPDITGPAQKAMLNQFLNLVVFYKTTYPSLAGNVLNSVIARTDGCPLRTTPDTIFTPGAGGLAGVDFVHTCPDQNLIYQYLIDAKAQLTGL